MSIYDIDFYKTGHKDQYPPKTSEVFSNWTARSSRIPTISHIVFFGLQYYLKEYLEFRWYRDFFYMPKDAILREYESLMSDSGISVNTDHLADLHDLGYMPLEFYALPEGTHVPLRCPMFVVRNTHPDFFWLTNYIESQLSNVLWGPCTAATIASKFREVFEAGMTLSDGPQEFVDIQGHDFSYRGLYGSEAAQLSGAGHLLSFRGTDTVPAIRFLQRYYGAEVPIGGSIPATEHSVMCMGTREDEEETYRRLIEDVYPSGPVSIVSDTWDYWKVLTETLPKLKDKILNREGMVVIRPDSGDPEKIICGDPDAPEGSPEYKGTMQVLYETFGGEINKKGFFELSPKVGIIYGDSITMERASKIVSELIAQRFVPRVVFGIGSYTYQHVTRDTFGFAMKSTAGIVDGEVREIYKDPKTDDGTKKSLRGYVSVHNIAGRYEALDRGDPAMLDHCAFQKVWKDGNPLVRTTFDEVRGRVRNTRPGPFGD